MFFFKFENGQLRDFDQLIGQEFVVLLLELVSDICPSQLPLPNAETELSLSGHLVLVT